MAQLALDVQTVQQMAVPLLLTAQSIRGERGHWVLLEQVLEHHPWPAPLLTQRPEAHSGLVLQGAPDGRLVQKEDGAQTSWPVVVVVQHPLTQAGFVVQVSVHRPPLPKSTQ